MPWFVGLFFLGFWTLMTCSHMLLKLKPHTMGLILFFSAKIMVKHARLRSPFSKAVVSDVEESNARSRSPHNSLGRVFAEPSMGGSRTHFSYHCCIPVTSVFHDVYSFEIRVAHKPGKAMVSPEAERRTCHSIISGPSPKNDTYGEEKDRLKTKGLHKFHTVDVNELWLSSRSH
jgi:hypothetical protein